MKGPMNLQASDDWTRLELKFEPGHLGRWGSRDCPPAPPERPYLYTNHPAGHPAGQEHDDILVAEVGQLTYTVPPIDQYDTGERDLANFNAVGARLASCWNALRGTPESRFEKISSGVRAVMLLGWFVERLDKIGGIPADGGRCHALLSDLYEDARQLLGVTTGTPTDKTGGV